MNSETEVLLCSEDQKINKDKWLIDIEVHKKFMDMLPEPVIACRDNKIMLANRCAMELLDCDSIEDIVGKDLSEFIYYEGKESKKDEICRHLFGDEVEILKAVKIITSKNRIIDVEVKGSIFKEYNLRLMVLSDTSELKILKNKQENIEKKYKILFSNANDAIFLIDFDKKRFNLLDVNDAACESLGYSKKELLELSIYDIDYNTNKLNDITNNLNYDGRTIFETILKKKDGKLINAEVSAHVFELNGGKVLLSIARDITERKEIENRLKESEDRSRNILEILPEGIFVHDGEKFLFANPEGMKLLRIDKNQDLIGKPIMDFIHPQYRDIVYERKEKILQYGCNIPLKDAKVILKDGTVVDVEAVGTSIIYDGKKAAIIAIRDIGYRKRTEKLKREIEKKERLLIETIEHERLRTEFLSNISHEFKTPLNAILTAQQLLRLVLKNAMENNPSIENYMAIMKKNCFRILRMTNNILDMAEMENECYKLNITNSDIAEAINQIIKPIGEYLANRKIDFSYKTDINKMVVACDPGEIQRVLLNLISNSIKSIDSGGKIEVSLYHTERNVRINVKDTGCGIPEDKLEYVFDALRQVDKSFTRNSEGSGLGLYIVKYIIKKHGGNVKVKSKLGEGSEFEVMLPIRRIDETQKDIINKKVENYLKNDPLEKVSIEFSDIY